MSSYAPATAARSRRHLRRLFDVALFVWGVAAATNLVAGAANEARQAAGWPRWLELVYLVAAIVAIPALLVAAWAKARLRRAGAVVQDERTAASHTRAMSVALVGVFVVLLPFLVLHVEVPSAAQAKFVLAATLVVYGAARLWFNRDA